MFLRMVAVALRPERYFEFICRDGGSASPCKGGSMSKGKALGVLGAFVEERVRGA